MSKMSDSESSDSDRGIRYKTESTRHKSKTKNKLSHHKEYLETSTKSLPKESARSKKHKKKRYNSSSDDDASKLRRIKNKDRKKEKKHSKKKKRNKEKKVETSDSESTDNSVGSLTKETSQTSARSSNSRVIGPVIPDQLSQIQSIVSEKPSIIGPVLPSTIVSNQTDEQRISDYSIEATLPTQGHYENHPDSKEVSERIGPMLPPHLRKEQIGDLSEKIIGPVLPPHLRDKLLCSEESSVGPLPDPLTKIQAESTEDDSDDEIYGPLPAGTALSKAHIELEERALQMQIDKLDPQENKEPTREEWMTELPAAKAANFGLGPRQFRTKAGPDLSDRSSWTDTPQDKANKKLKKTEPGVDYKKEAELNAMRKRDRDQEAIIKKIKRDKESLVEMHTKKMKKKEDAGPVERRPFSRDVDLQVNRFDEAQKKSVLKKAQLLDTRFSSGESKYL